MGEDDQEETGVESGGVSKGGRGEKVETGDMMRREKENGPRDGYNAGMEEYGGTTGEDKKGRRDGTEGRRRSPRLAEERKKVMVVAGKRRNRKDRRNKKLGRGGEKHEHTRFFVKHGLLFEKSGSDLKTIRICVPEEKIKSIIADFHSSPRAGHPSAKRTADMIRKIFTFPDLHTRVQEEVRRCYECQTNKTTHHKEYGSLTAIYSPPNVFHTLGIDFVTGLTPAGQERFDAITVSADKFSKFGIFYPSKMTDTAKDTANRFIRHVYPWTGLPARLISDRDVRFTSEFWRTLVDRLGIHHAMSTAYHPQTDGQVERLNQQLAALLRHTVAIDQHDWPDMLPAAMMAYNSQVHESTGRTPYEVVFGRTSSTFPFAELAKSIQDSDTPKDLTQLLALHADVQDNIIRAQTQQTLEYNKRHKE
ncbi:hypothetical protein A4X09_0g7610 [Tilletia walkeri]|uniref:Integrase catalytic domain-containing protein n=1 Tax=Tilletia walkeri TaxID=117179 RepID=A0A8X7N2U5_9BASI|nr:hypothetical protein A4X09_0g7610 [Tilletia walkeri]